MRAKLWHINTSDFGSWEEFLAYRPEDPTDAFGWFGVDVGGDEDGVGSDYFQVLIATATAIGRAQGNESRFRGLVVPIYEPTLIEQFVRDYVESVEGSSQDELVERLRLHMRWEYEGAYPQTWKQPTSRGHPFMHVRE